MNAQVPLNWNELLVVSRFQGQVACWTAWKRAIAAFQDPRMWHDTEQWGGYFQRQPEGAAWGIQGYGIIVIDLDRRLSWSVNDYSTPTQLTLPNTSNVHSGDRPDTQALLALLGARDQLKCAAVHLVQVPPAPPLLPALSSSGGATDKASPRPRRTWVTLDQIVPEGTAPEAAHALLTQDRGTLKWKGKEWLVLAGRYEPEGWAHRTDRGADSSVVLQDLLSDLHQAGFPAPDRVALLEHAQGMSEDMDEGDASVFMGGITALLDGWKEATPAPRSPTP